MSWTRSNLDRSVERNEGAILVDIISQLYTSNDDVTEWSRQIESIQLLIIDQSLTVFLALCEWISCWWKGKFDKNHHGRYKCEPFNGYIDTEGEYFSHYYNLLISSIDLGTEYTDKFSWRYTREECYIERTI